MNLTDVQKGLLVANLSGRAADNMTSPERALGDGIVPERWVRTPDGARARVQSEYAAYLYAVARQALKAGTWRIDEDMGVGQGSAHLVIL